MAAWRFTIFFSLTALIASAQSELSFSVPIIYSTVSVKDNWTPTTAPSYKEYLRGSAIGYGAIAGYSFKPGLLIKNKNFRMTAAVGYYNQVFNITRPFNYSSQIYIGFFTEKYSYHCLQGSLGLSYNIAINKKYAILSRVNYNWLYSIKQKYTPTRDDFPSQVNNDQINFGGIFMLSTGVHRTLRENLSVGLNILVPVLTKWRNDKIFDDDPSTSFHPEFSLGTSIDILYHIRK